MLIQYEVYQKGSEEALVTFSTAAPVDVGHKLLVDYDLFRIAEICHKVDTTIPVASQQVTTYLFVERI